MTLRPAFDLSRSAEVTGMRFTLADEILSVRRRLLLEMRPEDVIHRFESWYHVPIFMGKAHRSEEAPD